MATTNTMYKHCEVAISICFMMTLYINARILVFV